MNEKTVSQILEEIAQSICDTRCKYPNEWDKIRKAYRLMKVRSVRTVR